MWRVKFKKRPGDAYEVYKEDYSSSAEATESAAFVTASGFWYDANGNLQTTPNEVTTEEC